MSGYAAVNDAFKMAESKQTLLKRVAAERAERAANVDSKTHNNSEKDEQKITR